jgi:hypothetical protein
MVKGLIIHGSNHSKGDSMNAETAYRISSLSRNPEVVRICSRFHVDTPDRDAVQQACGLCSGIETAPGREVFIFAAAIIRRHHENRAAYTVALRRAV